ncbi:MAG: PIN domain-containing protein [Planctomycetota bacterium]|jgi:predicted nucleic acid-binding protein|nr:PIN domain-containing protein [Planctomycetota bacterium]
MRIYLDVCCLNRPFDDLSQDRVYLEAEAVLSIVSRCEKGEWTLVASGILDFEVSNMPDADRQDQVRMLYIAARERVKLTDEAERRSVFFRKHGIKPFDSLHLALAETSGADVFLTTDDRLLKAAQKMNLKISVSNPVSWLMRMTRHGQ